jgi:hypothetical protein
VTDALQPDIRSDEVFEVARVSSVVGELRRSAGAVF